MTPAPSSPRRAPAAARARAAAAAVLALAVVWGAGPATAATPSPVGAVEPAVAEDPAVAGATADLATARRALADAQDRLDSAVRAYEDVRAQHERLVEEFAEADRGEAEAAAADAAAEVAADAVAESYRQRLDVMLVAESVLAADDAGSALHRATLLERLAVRGRNAAERARDRARQAAQRAADREVIAAGVAAAAASRQRQAERLAQVVTDARDGVEQASSALDRARSDASARIVAQAADRDGEPTDSTRRDAATRGGGAGTAAAADGTWREPIVAGRSCPVAQPNGFIDSWGFARSGGRRHQGVDMFAAYGTPVYAVADGTITKVGDNRLGGLSLHLVDRDGHRYYYAHLSAEHVTQGEQVSVGQVIGAVGDSGNAKGTPPHLHWEQHPGGGDAVNPYPLARALCRESGTGV